MNKIGQFIHWLQANLWYSIFIVTLAVLSIILLAYELFYPGVTERGHQLAREIDLIIAYIFLTDFFLGLFFTRTIKGKAGYFKDNWLNLVSSIPITNEVARAFRLLRIFRALRVIRAIMNFRFAQKRHHDVTVHRHFENEKPGKSQ